MDYIIQIAGAILVLVGYTLGQLGKVDPNSRIYLSLNFIGSAFLALDAFNRQQWGFLILNGVWATIALANLLRSAGPPNAERQEPSS